MSVARPRNRLVVFRLSQEEYTSLKQVCTMREARSVSDFARSAVLRTISTEGAAGSFVDRRLAVLADKLSRLESGVRHVLRLLEPPRDGQL